ncbi:fimbria/pilus outer membrane usher protein [Glaciimonas soli]|uniref:fimbria/pilus outer membrane usher protein n=1 Tax=Glaciimonas soli TaxID=2590999 RepID=UPI001884CFA5|nr:fimbria/pilus outer membrane usher protein [Glaciimonas soli]
MKLNRYVVKCALASFFICHSLHAMAVDDVAQSTSNNKDYQLNNLAVTLNGRTLSDGALILQIKSNSDIMLPAQLLSDARIRLPTIPAYRFHDENYYPVSAITGMETHIDSLTQTLDIQVPASAFIESEYHLNSDNSQAPLHPSAVGAFVNYDINYSRNADVNAVSGLAEAGVFDGHGTFTSRFVAIEHSGSDVANTYPNTNANSAFRLDTQYTRDFPSQMATLVVGDSISGASNFSRQVYFGGLQWKTNFATVPGYQPIPLPSMSGSAAVPSTVDIYVDNILRMRQAVDAGPFTINNVPLTTGQGNVQMVVNDVLGRQQIYTQSYIASAQLLQAGLKNVSYEIGALRNNFGLQNSYYGSAFSSATVRYGVSNNLTSETHGEIMAGHQSVGTGAAVTIHNVGVISGGVGVSNSNMGNGTLQYLQFDRQNSLYALTVRAQTASARFWQLGTDANTPVPSRQIQAQASVTLNANTNISLGYLDQRAPQASYLDTPLINTNAPTNFRAINAGINFNLRQAGTVSLGVFKSMGDGNTLSTNITWILPLDNQRLLSLSANLQKNNNSYDAQFQQTAPQEGGWGYRLRKTLETNAGEDIGANYLNDIGEYTVAASQQNGDTNLLAEARGGIVMMGGYVRPTR